MMNQPILLETNRTKIVVMMLVLCPVSIAASYFALSYMDEWYGVTMLRTCVLILLCALGLVGSFALILTLVKMFTLPKHALRIDHEGLHVLHGDFKNKFISWKNIEGFRLGKMGFSDIVYVQVNNAQDLIKDYTGLKRTLIDKTIQMHGTPVILMPMTYKDMTANKLMQLLHNAQMQARV